MTVSVEDFMSVLDAAFGLFWRFDKVGGASSDSFGHDRRKWLEVFPFQEQLVKQSVVRESFDRSGHLEHKNWMVSAVNFSFEADSMASSAWSTLLFLFLSSLNGSTGERKASAP